MIQSLDSTKKCDNFKNKEELGNTVNESFGNRNHPRVPSYRNANKNSGF